MPQPSRYGLLNNSFLFSSFSAARVSVRNPEDIETLPMGNGSPWDTWWPGADTDCPWASAAHKPGQHSILGGILSS